MSKEKLSNLYDIGSSKRVFQAEWRDKGVPFYRAREIARLSSEGYVDNELFIDEDLYDEYIAKYGKPQPGDVMVTGVGTLGVCYVVKPEDKFYFKDGNILWFRQKAPDRILPEYLVKAFDSKEVKDFISKNSSGTTVGTFTIQTANKMEISLPPLNQQKRIIERISKLEEIIKKRQHELEMLDELIKARFIEMFGDPIANPKGWDKPLIEDVVSAEKNSLKAGPFGSALKKEYYVRSGYKIYGQEQVIADDPYYGDYYIDEDRYKQLENCKVQAGDVLISLVGTYGKLLIMPEHFEPGIINPRLMKITFDKSKVNPHYFKFFFQSDALKKSLAENTHGGTMDILNLGIVRKLAMPLPPIDLQNDFVSFVKQVDKSKVIVQKALNEAQTLFDSLMQEYFG